MLCVWFAASKFVWKEPRLHHVLKWCGIHQWPCEHQNQVNLLVLFSIYVETLPHTHTHSHTHTLFLWYMLFRKVQPLIVLLPVTVCWCRGRVIYQLSLSLWRLLCLCYYAEARLEVLKLTKHVEDGTIKARWRIWGLPFYSLLLRFYRKDKSQLYR